MRFSYLLILTSLLVACASGPSQPSEPKVLSGKTLAVVGFRDCLIGESHDCMGSGGKVAREVASMLNDPPALKTMVLERPVSSGTELSDADAAIYGRIHGYDYVINGVVPVYRTAFPASMSAQKVGMAVHVLRTSDAFVVDSYECQVTFDNLTPLSTWIGQMAAELRDSLEDVHRNWFERLFHEKPSCDDSPTDATS